MQRTLLSGFCLCRGGEDPPMICCDFCDETLLTFQKLVVMAHIHAREVDDALRDRSKSTEELQVVLRRRNGKQTNIKTVFSVPPSFFAAMPAQIFCSRCGFLNDGGNLACVQCDNTIRSTMDKIRTDLKDSTNSLARYMGVNIHVKCPGCLVVCYVPPATACLRCGSCHTYFASPSVGEVTNFHMSRLSSSISSSFMGFFGRKRGGQENEATSIHVEAREAPIARLIAAGQSVLKSPRSCSTFCNASEQFISIRSQAVEEETDIWEDPNVLEKTSVVDQVIETDKKTQEALDNEYGDMSQGQIEQRLSLSDDNSSSFCHSGNRQPMFARTMPLRAALPIPRQEMVQVEGDIVEL
ncbi:hypothetical protein PsorP6_003690 [Peronosclerospora sorghi]|uniref:Uncharacterized protein n=1 Tax=Peronosclerospora sorghi TaxID=230839 RepID=A0ACC0VQ70_9STRA|nr:hypothetical protein PsorP6_003690 [Peronosclerospora sorghi]